MPELTSPHSTELAGMNKPTLRESRQLFLEAVSDLGIRVPDAREATICLAKDISKKIISGSITPYEGARKIWWELSNVEGADERLLVFSGLASEIEDTQNKAWQSW